MIQELDPTKQSERSQEFESELRRKLVGQDKAISSLIHFHKLMLAGFNTPGKPIGNLLFLGPTGSGKTRAMEAVSEIFWGDTEAMIKIDCAEFQADHEISKVIGAPPGYLGHSNTEFLITEEKIDKYALKEGKPDPKHPFCIILFDEIEKASDRLFQLLLGILDKATLTLGNNKKVKMNRCFIVMTSNLGTSDVKKIMNMIGFSKESEEDIATRIDKQHEKISMDAVEKRFSQEFINRLDEIVVFNTLTKTNMVDILEIELQRMQMHIIHESDTKNQFIFSCSQAVKDFFLQEGYSHKFGARPLKRVLEKHLLMPLAELSSTGQIQLGDEINVVLKDNKLKFFNVGNRLAS